MEKRYIYDSTMLGYLEQNIGSIADREFAQIGEDSTVTEAAKLMRDKPRVYSLPRRTPLNL